MSDSYHVTDISGNTIVYTKPKPYVWDGKSRPNVDDYISPWVDMASKTKYKFTGSHYKKRVNEMISYAQNQLKAAQAQYDNDIAFWNERDERSYTTQSAQAHRFEDAGFNMGYMYSQVDNGNSAVGYNQSSSDFEPVDNTGDELGGFKLVFDIVSSAFTIGTALVKAGISLKKLPDELRLLRNQSNVAFAQSGYYTELANNENLKGGLLHFEEQLQLWLQTHKPDGTSTDIFSDSLAVAMEQLSYKMKDQERIDLVNWNAVSAEIYKLQSTPSASQSFNEWIMSQNIPDWAKVVCIVLGAGIANVMPNYGVRKTIK